MCLTTKMLKPEIAEQDITVYKVLHVAWEGARPHSPYKHEFEWRIGHRHSSVMDTMPFMGEVNRGFHSFKSLEDAQSERNDWGFFNYPVYKAIIPAGSRYYVGKFGDAVSYASDRLIIVEAV